MEPRGNETVPMTRDEKAFFRNLGNRVALLRKDQGLTQTELGDRLGLTQQQLAHYEVARRRFPASLLPGLARELAVSLDDLVGEDKKPGKRGPAPKVQQQLERIAQLPRPRQRIVLEILDSVLQQNGR